mgnify:FL=1
MAQLAFILDVLIIEHLMLITDGVPLKRIGWVWKILAVIIVFIVVLWPIFDHPARTCCGSGDG